MPAAIAAAALWLLVGVAPVTAEDGGPPPLDAALFAQIDTFLTGEREASGIPGLAVVIVADDQVVHTAALGVADGAGRPVTTDTPFVLASVSKAFTATAVMQLVEAGRIRLDAPVQQYVPWFRVADAAAAGRITIAQLLHHTSGIPTVFVANDDQDAEALERSVRALASEDLLFDPGTGYHYTNADYNLLGLVVQTVSGLPFDRYVEEQIFAPLGMDHSHVLAGDAFADGASEAFFRWFGAATLATSVPHPRAEGPAAMLFSSANDMGRWIIANLNGGRVGQTRIVSDAGMAELHSPAAEIDPEHAYAMGWVVRPYWEALAVAGAPATSYALPALIEHEGASPTAHAYVGLVPERGWGFAVLMNTYDWLDGSPYGHVEQGIQRLLAGKEPLPAFAGPDPIVRNSRNIAIGLLALELVSLAWSVRVIRRWRRTGGALPARRMALAIVTVPLLLDAVVLALVVLYIPTAFGASLTEALTFQPDAPWVLLPLLLLAALWGPARTITLVSLRTRTRPERAA